MFDGREINNIGEPLRAPDGTPLGGIKITWVLCTSKGLPIDALDVESRERIFPVQISAVTSKVDTEELKVGEFKRPGLWPTSRADRQVFYKCSATAGMKDFIAPLVEGETPLKFSDFANSGGQLVPGQVPNTATLLLFSVVNGQLHWNGEPVGAGGVGVALPPDSVNDYALVSIAGQQQWFRLVEVTGSGALDGAATASGVDQPVETGSGMGGGTGQEAATGEEYAMETGAASASGSGPGQATASGVELGIQTGAVSGSGSGNKTASGIELAIETGQAAGSSAATGSVAASGTELGVETGAGAGSGSGNRTATGEEHAVETGAAAASGGGGGPAYFYDFNDGLDTDVYADPAYNPTVQHFDTGGVDNSRCSRSYGTGWAEGANLFIDKYKRTVTPTQAGGHSVYLRPYNEGSQTVRILQGGTPLVLNGGTTELVLESLVWTQVTFNLALTTAELKIQVLTVDNYDEFDDWSGTVADLTMDNITIM